ncbi:hypothetical protein E1B28_006795 [Marasmius oreades]|uniref:Uncharacterized protein n=1 Tax=Marasmius oreades TaxID=181124 RepID=A0A9P7UWU4_9AGAR|nr:uncharacterized protein E1B28_006795 [Marasmius oreades]KAG7096121.1 hypothetical protein E1B28_006795 [Marasmius oreades]
MLESRFLAHQLDEVHYTGLAEQNVGGPIDVSNSWQQQAYLQTEKRIHDIHKALAQLFTAVNTDIKNRMMEDVNHTPSIELDPVLHTEECKGIPIPKHQTEGYEGIPISGYQSLADELTSSKCFLIEDPQVLKKASPVDLCNEMSLNSNKQSYLLLKIPYILLMALSGLILVVVIWRLSIEENEEIYISNLHNLLVNFPGFSGLFGWFDQSTPSQVHQLLHISQPHASQ